VWTISEGSAKYRASSPGRVLESRRDAWTVLGGEVTQYVPTADDVERRGLPHVGARIDEVLPLERHHASQGRDDGEAVSDRTKVSVADRIRSRAERPRSVDPRARPRDDVGIDVDAEDRDVPRLGIRDSLAQRHRERVRFFPAGTSSG